MTDLCLRGGKAAVEEYEKSHPFNNRCEYYPDYTTFLKKIITECPNNHDEDIDNEYISLKKEIVNFCSKDSVTGEECWIPYKDMDFTIPYSQWKPYQCESSCVAEYDAVLREEAKTPRCYYKSAFEGNPLECYIFKTSTNPLDSCGNPNYVEPKTSDATTLTSHIALFSIIMCLIFAFFK